MKTLSTLLILLSLSTFAFSGNGGVSSKPTFSELIDNLKGNATISGIVIDSATRQPVPFATITLSDPTTKKPVDGTICEENGKFSLAKVSEGNYLVIISFIGYKPKTLTVTVDSKKDEIELGTVLLSPAIEVLKEITIEGQRSLIEEKVDRTVYHAEGDASNKGGDATDVLRKVPNLSVDLDGNVSIRGSQSIRVLINNRPSTIAASSVADALKQIPSDMIVSVEVITSPSAKYDAEGSAGIINIITKKNAIDGFSLNINSSAGLRGSNLGLNGSFRKGKMAFSLGGWGRAGYNVKGSFQNRQETFIHEDTTLLSLQSADTRTNMMFGRYQLGWDYDINKKNFLSASLQLGLRNFNNSQDNLLSESFKNGVYQNKSVRDVNVSDLSNTWDLNLNYIRSFEKPQKEFSILSQWSRNNRTNDFINAILDEDFSESEFIKNLNESYNQEITVQADYLDPIAKNQILELGAKQIIRNVISDYQYYHAGADEIYTPSTDNNLGNIFNYQQNVSSGYFSYTLNLPKNYSIKAGSRYEYTTIDASFENDENKKVNIKPYGVLVPSVNISKKLKSGNTIKAAYNRRIQRPSLQFLNPNRQSSNPLQPTIGNPDLKPEYTNNYELSYSTYIKSTSIFLTGFMRNTTGAIQSIRLEPEGNRITTTYRNIGKEDAYGLSLFTNIRIGNKLTLNGGTDVYYSVLTNNVPDPEFNASNEGWVASFRAFGSYNLGKGWGLQLFSFYRGNQVQLQGKQGGFGIYSLNVKKDFNNERGSIGFGAENFLNTKGFKMKNEISSAFINQSSTNVMYNMNFKVNFSYRIGKLNANDQPRKRRRSVSNDDLKQGGDSSSDAPQGGGAPAPAGRRQGGPRPQSGQQIQNNDKNDNQKKDQDAEVLDNTNQKTIKPSENVESNTSKVENAETGKGPESETKPASEQPVK
ncbi:MAG TPA: TonB-dependent receptor [Cytophagales bacterium]|nr:TonB-dependent receptor [Cytophagales bacterium]